LLIFAAGWRNEPHLHHISKGNLDAIIKRGGVSVGQSKNTRFPCISPIIPFLTKVPGIYSLSNLFSIGGDKLDTLIYAMRLELNVLISLPGGLNLKEKQCGLEGGNFSSKGKHCWS
jgi:hypothetical protein